MTTATFRRDWIRTVPYGALDIVMHAVAAFLWLPGPWWFQYLPDAVLPVLWLRSMATNRMAGDDDLWLQLHRMLHVKARYFHTGVLLWWLLALASGAALDVNIFVLPLHVAVHKAIDWITHGEGWQ